MPSPSAARWKAFPPGRGNIKVPVSSRAAALAGLALYTPCLRNGYAVRDAAWAAVRLLGPRALPGRAGSWQPPVDAEAWAALEDSWRREVGAFTDLALYERVQAERAGALVLLLDGPRSVAFVRVQAGGAERFAAEARILSAVADAAPVSFWHPTPIASGAVGELAWHAVTPLRPQRHRAARRLPATVLADVRRALAPALPRPPGTPAAWEPMHGDLTPWNLRRLDRGEVALIDWEDAAWAPAGADAVLFAASAAALWGDPVEPAPAEAVAFWHARIAGRHAQAPHPLSAATLDALARMSPDNPLH